MKTYLVREDFWIGEINKGVKKGDTVNYDEGKCLLNIGGKTYDVKNIKAAVKAAWLIPQDGKLPELDGPVGETAVEFSDRKRKERFAALVKLENENNIVKDERELSRIGGTFEEGTPEYYAAMGIDPNPKIRGNFKATVIEDDTVVISTTIEKSKEIKQLKKAMNQETKDKVDPTKFKVSSDHHNDGMIQVSKYVSDEKDQTIKTWSQLHWTKKADVIKTADKSFLSQIKEVESSAKIMDRIKTRLQEL
jgi:hypothetical protein